MCADLNEIYYENQKAICLKYRTDFFESNIDLKIGISRNVKDNILPINGLRIYPEGDTTGWYIWAGEDVLHEIDFVPLHVVHIDEWRV